MNTKEHGRWQMCPEVAIIAELLALGHNQRTSKLLAGTGTGCKTRNRQLVFTHNRTRVRVRNA